jgi:hypothetical protein
MPHHPNNCRDAGSQVGVIEITKSGQSVGIKAFEGKFNRLPMALDDDYSLGAGPTRPGTSASSTNEA